MNFAERIRLMCKSALYIYAHVYTRIHTHTQTYTHINLNIPTFETHNLFGGWWKTEERL